MLFRACGNLIPQYGISSKDYIGRVPSPMKIVHRMLELAEIQEGELVYDLGCGDGRILINAAKKYGARGVGIEIDKERIEDARRRALPFADRITFRRQNVFEVDLRRADVVTIYLLPVLNKKLMPQLRKNETRSAHRHALLFTRRNGAVQDGAHQSQGHLSSRHLRVPHSPEKSVMGYAPEIEALWNRAIELFGQGQYAKALDCLLQLEPKLPDHSKLLSNLGVVYRDSGDLARAEHYRFRRLLRIATAGRSGVHFNLAVTLLRAGRFA